MYKKNTQHSGSSFILTRKPAFLRGHLSPRLPQLARLARLTPALLCTLAALLPACALPRLSPAKHPIPNRRFPPNA